MEKSKFNERDRDHVITEIEAHMDVRLERVGNYRKFLQDNSGRSFWVFGGYEDWHGITSSMMDEELRRDTDGVLVVAKRQRSSIAVFHGTLRPLIAARRELSHTQTGDYQFNVAIRGNSMTIKEVVGLTLRRLGDMQDVGLAQSARVAKLDALIEKMSPDERRQLLARLAAKNASG